MPPLRPRRAGGRTAPSWSVSVSIALHARGWKGRPHRAGVLAPLRAWVEGTVRRWNTAPGLRIARVGGRDDETLQNEGQGQRICAGGREGGHRCCMVPAPAAQRVEGTRWFASVNTRRIERTGASRRAGGSYWKTRQIGVRNAPSRRVGGRDNDDAKGSIVAIAPHGAGGRTTTEVIDGSGVVAPHGARVEGNQPRDRPGIRAPRRAGGRPSPGNGLVTPKERPRARG